MKILLTGATGRLGTELRKLRKFDYTPSSKELDITKNIEIPKDVGLIVHCAAYTDVENAEVDKTNCYMVNVEGTKNLSNLGLPMLYISTEYVFDGEKGNYKETETPNPINFYALTKLLGEIALNPLSKIVRTSFKERPFQYPKAFVDQWTSGDYVDTIAKEINIAIENFDKLPRLIHVGTGRKSIYELAKQSRDVEPNSRMEIKTPLPKDTSLNINKWIRFKNNLQQLKEAKS